MLLHNNNNNNNDDDNDNDDKSLSVLLFIVEQRALEQADFVCVGVFKQGTVCSNHMYAFIYFYSLFLLSFSTHIFRCLSLYYQHIPLIPVCYFLAPFVELLYDNYYG